MIPQIQHIRNIHLYRYANIVYPHIITPKTPYLALCGNIIHPTDSNYRIYRSFLRYCSDHWEKVFYIPGPTENVYVEAVEELCEGHRNIHFLDSRTYKIPAASLNIVGETSLYSSEKWINAAVADKSNVLLLTYSHVPLFINVLGSKANP